MDFLMNDAGNFDNASIESNSLGDKNLYRSGELVATQKQGTFAETTSTYEDGNQIASTKENVINGTDIIQDGKHTGIIKEDVNGNLSLYDTNYNKLAHLDPNGNVQSVMTHVDPLSQVNKVNFQELKFHSEG